MQDRKTLRLALLSWLVASLILVEVVAYTLLDIVDASYTCLVLDLDRATLTGTFHRPEMAEVLISKVQPGPMPGPAIYQFVSKDHAIVPSGGPASFTGGSCCA
uniref:Uncharacterized protein n=1 Tax=Calcidiscus leptoporus TaxID=127549 RepID=A0A7S0NV55_9EUKA|mmetsp:Transcript_29716/g.69361  ORF Transcript_29716/g.69361 Transcript_29716/m.69361 type:complete len:103 (+) Transcript_29716:2-310(+)